MIGKNYRLERTGSQFIVKRLLIVTCLAFALATSSQARADVITGYINDPTANSSDFTGGVAGLGGSVTTLNVGSLPTGVLNPLSFSGVTLTGTGPFGTVSFGSGPSQGNTSALPTSTGEGLHAASSFIGDDSTNNGTLTVSFNTPVLGAGLFLIDLFNPPGCSGPCDNVTIEAFTGQDGTGSSLGIFSAAEDNFQENFLYFMGISSSGNDIGSIVLNQPANVSGDIIGLGNILVGSGSSTPVPEPGSLALLGSGLIGFFLLMARYRRT